MFARKMLISIVAKKVARIFLKFIVFCFLLSCVFQSSLSNPLNTNIKKVNQFQNATSGYWYKFPQDHLSHPEYANEWWYYTGNLTSKRLNKEFGYQLTFFRVALEPEGENIYLAHFALSDIKNKKFYFSELMNRNLLQKAGVKAKAPLIKGGEQSSQKIQEVKIWNQNWSSTIVGNGQEHLLKAFAHDENLNQDYSITLNLQTNKTPVIQGKKGEGISRKGSCPSCASHYYSYPSLDTYGNVIIDGEKFEVTGQSWMDHEFGSSQLMENQVGWDWFSIQLFDGSSLMLYRIREANGKTSEFSSGTFTTLSGQSQHLEKDDFFLFQRKYWQSKKTKISYPLVWDITVPKSDLALRVIPKMTNQELITNKSTKVSYWEGAIEVLDRVSGKKLGDGYLELTGYDGKLKGKF